MSNKNLINQEGEIFETLSNTMFRVRLKNGHEILATVSGKMKMKFVRMVEGDRVALEMSPYDLTRGRIKARIDAFKPTFAPGSRPSSGARNRSVSNRNKRK